MKERKGYVFKEKGKWFARVTFTDGNGNRRNVKRTAKSRPLAKSILRELVKDIDDAGETALEVWNNTFNDLADYYELNYAKPAKFVNNQKVEGLRDYKRVRYFVSQFRRFFGKRKLKEITYEDIYSYRTLRLETLTPTKRKRTIATMNRELAYLRRMFNIALRKGWLEKNPINCGEPLILSSYERRRERILTVEEEANLLAACDHPQRKHLKPLLIALLHTGARLGETLKLDWASVDFDNKLITFQALNTKTLKARQVGMTKTFLVELETLWENSDRQMESSVFGIKNNVRRSFSTACKIAGIKEGGIDGLTLHCLRHTAATRMVQGNLPIQMVGRILGHTQPQTTYRYLTADNETLHKAALILDC